MLGAVAFGRIASRAWRAGILAVQGALASAEAGAGPVLAPPEASAFFVAE
jgi:hypothetical protein